MVFIILLDEQMTGYARYIRSLIASKDWASLAQDLDVRFATFAESGLATGTSDRELFQFRQAQSYYLLTDNRNSEGIDSLGEMIRTCVHATSLPVFNVANRERFARERSYAHRVVETLLEKLIDWENLMGTGRHYLPSSEKKDHPVVSDGSTD